MTQLKHNKKMFPKKAKLITDGGFYRIIKIDGFSAKITVPMMRKISLNTPETDWSDIWKFNLIFVFNKVRKGYAEYIQIDCIKVENVIIK
jgi:hypothetical protein